MLYNETITNFIKEYTDLIGLDFSLIHRIHIIVFNQSTEWIGKVNPITVDDKLCFELLFQQSILNDLISDDPNKVELAQNVIQHELFHCKELLTTSHHINWKDLYYHPSITTTKILLLDTAFKQWSEYYAYYNSSKTNERDVRISDNIYNVDTLLKLLHNELIRNTSITDIQIPYSFITNMIDFIHTCVMFVAHYNSTGNEKYQREFEHIHQSQRYKKYHPYLMDLARYMNELYSTYPQWVSESKYIELGHRLFSFIQIHNLTFTTEDLSDNFILKEM